MRHRLDALRLRLADEGLDAVLISHPLNIAYITGFEGVFDDEDAHALAITQEHASIFTDSRYRDAVTRAAAGSEWQIRAPRANLYVTACDELASLGVESLAVEESVPYGRFRFISGRFEGRVEAVDHWVEEIRQVKNAEELRRMEAAQSLTDSAFDHVLGLLRPGASERSLALEIEMFMRREGSDGVAFPAIVASGPNSAFPHAHATERSLESGDLVVMDFGARVDGYCADMTRTVVIGRASERQREVYGVVTAANETGIATVRAGIPGSEVDGAARSLIESCGYGENFGHGLGHGVGMAVHELPTVGPRGVKSLLAGSVITIEPGIYIDGFGGVRIEDLVVVEDGGARVLTRSTKDLLEL